MFSKKYFLQKSYLSLMKEKLRMKKFIINERKITDDKVYH